MVVLPAPSVKHVTRFKPFDGLHNTRVTSAMVIPWSQVKEMVGNVKVTNEDLQYACAIVGAGQITEHLPLCSLLQHQQGASFGAHALCGAVCCSVMSHCAAASYCG